MFIRSERLFLRPGWPEDWQELLGQIDDESVARNLAQVPWPYTAEDARQFASQVTCGSLAITASCAAMRWTRSAIAA